MTPAPSFKAEQMENVSSILRSRSLPDREFEKISEMVYAICRINLHVGKKELVQARLNKRLRMLNIDSYKDYLKYIEKDETGVELSTMVDILTTNLTYFFREKDHFNYLLEQGKVKLVDEKRKRFRIWSAGCASGEEAYSIAITLDDAIKGSGCPDFRILATDISSQTLETAKEGLFPKQRMKETPEMVLKKYFAKETAQDGTVFYRVSAELKRKIAFRRLNLMDPWPMTGPFDAVFCRNVMIYFDKKTQAELVTRFYNILAPGGVFFVGHSESLTGISHGFKFVRPSIYVKD